MNVRELKDNSGVVFSPKVSADSVYLSNSPMTLSDKLWWHTAEVNLINDGTSFNSCHHAGFYRMSDISNSDGPPNAGSYGNLIVSRFEGADSCGQIYFDIFDNSMWFRNGNRTGEPWNSPPNQWAEWKHVVSTSSDGGITATGFYVSSLRSLKENIEPTKVNATDLIDSQEIVDFNYKADEDKVHKVGLIADDSDPLFLDKKGETVDLYNTCGILMKAVQELSARVKELESKIN